VKSTKSKAAKTPRAQRRFADWVSANRCELILLVVVFVIGTVLRLVALSRSAVEHFDEGVYASNFYFPPPELAYPMQRFYAPPLLPSLIEAGMIAQLPPNVAALLPSFIAGCGTIIAMWWLGRSWFGASVGVAAATLVSLSPYHVAYSATALTDVLLGLWLLLAVDALARSFATDDLRWAVAAGLFTGLAWWTKYNGWLPLAIGAPAAMAFWHWPRRGERSSPRPAVCFLVAAITALACWSPYWLSLQSQGGYGPIAANHAKYVVGPSGWFNSAWRQAANLAVMEQNWTSVGIGAALLVIFIARRLSRSESPQVFVQSKQRVMLLMLAIWWFGLSASTPLYWPYPRLLLPWLLASWLSIALMLREIADWTPRGAIVLACVGFALPLILPKWDQTARNVSASRIGLQSIARHLQSDCDQETRASPAQPSSGVTRVVYVLGEPALLFQLCAAGEPVVRPTDHPVASPAALEGRELPTFLAIGPHAHRDQAFAADWAMVQANWRLVASYDDQPSVIVWLDLNDPWQAPHERPLPERIELYRWQTEPHSAPP